MCIRDRHGEHPSVECQWLQFALLQTENATVQAYIDVYVPAGNTLEAAEIFNIKRYESFRYDITLNIRPREGITIFLSNTYSARYSACIHLYKQ